MRILSGFIILLLKGNKMPYLTYLSNKIKELGVKQVASQACKAGLPIETFLLALFLSGKKHD